MSKPSKSLLFIALLATIQCASFAQGQTSLFSERAFIKLLIENHPKTQRARLQQQVGQLEVQAARGAFDPVLGASFYRKEFQEKIYYNKTDGGILQPLTFLGMDLQAGIELNNGNFLNPERNTPVSGLAYAGLKLPLLQGMMMDRRRTDLRLSQIFRERTDIQLFDVQNDLLIDGLKAYWNWVKALQKVELLRGVLDNNLIVFQGIKTAFLQGDRPAIDTVEAFQQYQRILLQYNRELIGLQNAVNALQTYSFSTAGGGLIIESGSNASTFDDAVMYSAPVSQMLQINNLLDMHPGVRLLRNEGERLNTQLRWERERLKPRLDVSYNLMADSGMSPLEQTYFNDNYTIGLSLQFPLLLRNARARTQQFRAYLRQNQFALSDEYNFLQNAVEASEFAMKNLKDQVQLSISVTNDARRLYEAEITRFRLGESSVFLVNTRELQYLQAQNTLIDLRADEIMQTYKLMYDMGILYRIVEF